MIYLERLEAGFERKLGMTVSRRIGKAVARNHLRRLVRECFRTTLRPLMPEGSALLVVARREGAGYKAVAGELRAAVVNLSRKLISAQVEN